MYDGRSLSQPKALIPLFVTELWERYGFYVIQSLLTIFLTLHLHLSDKKTYSIVGTFTALSYITPMIGGFIADKVIGQKLSVIFGCITLLVSYLILSVEYSNIHSLYISLAGITVGTGLLKPNIACLVGTLYTSNDPRRDGGFSIYYAGMALGILLGTTIPYNLEEYYGWSITFISPACTMFIALLIFLLAIRKYPINNYANAEICIKNILIAFAFSVITFIISYILLDFPTIALIFFISLSIFSILLVLYISLNEDTIQKIRTISFLILCFISVLYWMLYFQMFLSLTLFTYHAVKHTFLGLTIHPTYFVAIESLGLIIIGPLLAPIFSRYYLKNDCADSAFKFLIAFIFVFLSFILIILSIYFTNGANLINPLWIIIAYLLISISEIFLSPVGLSMSTKLVRPEVVGLMVGVFFMSLGVGGYLAGSLAKLSSLPNNYSILDMKKTYLLAFGYYTFIAFLICIVAYLFFLLIKKINNLAQTNTL